LERWSIVNGRHVKKNENFTAERTPKKIKDWTSDAWFNRREGGTVNDQRQKVGVAFSQGVGRPSVGKRGCTTPVATTLTRRRDKERDGPTK